MPKERVHVKDLPTTFFEISELNIRAFRIKIKIEIKTSQDKKLGSMNFLEIR